MSRTALVLAAHGSNADASVNAQIRSYRDSLAKLAHFGEVAVTFHQGEPSFATVLDAVTAKSVTVVPVMTSAGYYADLVLPQELRRNWRFPELEVYQTAPVGTHPGIATLVRRRIDELMRANGLSAVSYTLAIVGHGTQRHAASRNATNDLVERIRRHYPSSDVLAAFLDDDPPVETILARARFRSIVVLPFLIGSGAHATRDIPRRLGMDVRENASWPITATSCGHSLICDRPIGADPGVVEIILDLADAARAGIREAG